MMRMTTVLVVVGFLAGAAGAEAALVDAHITLQKQGNVCRVVKVDKSVWVSFFDEGVAWRIENQGCDEPAYVEIGADISIGDHPLPPWCQRTYKVPDDVDLPPTCLIPSGYSSDGTYGFQVRVNCQPGQFCPPGDPEIVVERIRDQGFFLLDPLVKPSLQRLPVKVTLRKVAGRCEAQLASSATLLKEHKAVEWTFDNKCDKGPHYVDLRREAVKDKLMLPKECNQSGAIRESPMGARCHFENTTSTAGTYEYWVAVDCIGKASCTPTKATILVPR